MLASTSIGQQGFTCSKAAARSAASHSALRPAVSSGAASRTADARFAWQLLARHPSPSAAVAPREASTTRKPRPPKPDLAKVATLSLPPTSRLGELAAQLRDAPAGATIDLGGFVVGGALAEGTCEVLALTQPGVTLRNGTLRLTGGQRIAVTAAGVALEDVDVVGVDASTDDGGVGLLSVVGSGCGLELRRSSVMGGILVPGSVLLRADDGGRLVLEDCHVSSASGGMACSVTGASQLTSSRTTFQGCSSLLQVTAGSVAELDTCTFSGSSDTSGAVSVAHHGSSLTAVDCKWSANAGDGLSVQSGARAVLKGSSLCGSSAQGGVDVVGVGSSLTAFDTRFCDNIGDGGRVREGAQAVLQRCDFSSSVGRDGLFVSGPGSRAVATGCKFLDNLQCGVRFKNGASGELGACEIDATSIHGWAGLTADDIGTSVVARDCRLGDDESYGRSDSLLSVTSGAHVLLHRCAFQGSGSNVATGEGTRLELVQCSVEDVEGMTVCEGAVLEESSH